MKASGKLQTNAEATPRKGAEAALCESEERLRRVRFAGEVGIFEWDFGSGKNLCGEGFFKVMGRNSCDGEDLSFEEWKSWVHPDDLAQLLQQLDALMGGDGEGTGEYRVLAEDGGIRWILYGGEVIRDENGAPVRMVGTVQNITGRKETEEALRLSEEHLRMAGQAGNFGIFDRDLATGRSYWSPEMKAIFGLPPDYPVPTVDAEYEFLHPEDSDRFYAARLASLDPSGDGSHFAEVRVVWPDGSIRWVQSVGQVWFAGEGAARRPVRVSGLLLDVTERVELGRQLKEMNETLEARVAEQTREVRLLAEAVSHLVEGVVITGVEADWPESRIVFINEAMCRMSGYSAAELIGQPAGILLGGGTESALPSHIESDLARGRICETELVCKHATGRAYPAEIVITTLCDGGGCRTNHVSIHRSVGERRELEQEVINAVEVDRLRMAHDLHDDLGAILTGIKLRIEAGTSAVPPQAQAARQTLRSAGELIREAIVKTRQIAHGLRPVGSDPEDLMSALRELGKQISAAPGWRCRFVCPEPVLICDPVVANHLFRIAQEAATNAVKYSDGARLLILLKQVDGRLELVISDDGTGFDWDVKQAEGLGLHILNYRAKAIRGVLQVARRKRRGTRVECRVPLG